MISRQGWVFFAVVVLASFALNWLWEMLQMPAYVEMADRSWRETAAICTLCTLGDVGLTLAIYGVGALAAGQLRWGLSGIWNVYAATSVLGAGVAAAVEWRALALGSWSYNEHMPIVPVLGVGLWPFLQLPLLVPAALWCSCWWTRYRETAHDCCT